MIIIKFNYFIVVITIINFFYECILFFYYFITIIDVTLTIIDYILDLFSSITVILEKKQALKLGFSIAKYYCC